MIGALLLLCSGTDMNLEPTISFENGAPRVNSRALANFICCACKAAGLNRSVDVLVSTDSRIRELNRRYRSKDAPTDVLSFPAGESANGFAGDIAISYEIARKNARTLGHSMVDELRILILHGILHLAGYDHEHDRGEMGRKEIALRRQLGLPTGLIERSSSALPLANTAGAQNSGNSSVRRTTRVARPSRT